MEGRACFKYNDGPIQIPTPDFEETVPGEFKSTGEVHSIVSCETYDDFFSECVSHIESYRTDMPVWEILRTYFTKVCPESLIDPQISFLLNVESTCKEYKWTPDEIMEMDNFWIDAFSEVRYARNYSSNLEHDEIAGKLSSNKGSSGKPSRSKVANFFRKGSK